MKFTLALLVLVAAASAEPKLRTMKSPGSENSSNLGVYDGKRTTIKKHPYMVAIITDEEYSCAGTIVSKNWAVTLGDGVHGFSPSDVKIIAGTTNTVKGTIYEVAQIVMHPNYGKDDLDYDFACIKISGEFKWSAYIKQINVATVPPKAGTNLLVAGWGDTSQIEVEEGGTGRPLKEGTMNWMDVKTCKSTYEPDGKTWTDRMACASSNGKTTLCFGDWGSPLVDTEKTQLYGLFTGLITDGMCSPIAAPVALANVTDVSSWIKQTTGAE